MNSCGPQLAGLGLYGVTAYAVSRPRTEIGIRMAVGAPPSSVVRLVLTRVVVVMGMGMALGVGLSLWTSTYVATLLYGLGLRPSFRKTPGDHSL